MFGERRQDEPERAIANLPAILEEPLIETGGFLRSQISSCGHSPEPYHGTDQG